MQQNTTSDLLLQILEIAKFSGDKKEHIEEFEAMNHLEAMTSLSQRLPEDIKQRATELTKDDLEKIRQLIPQEDYLKEVEKIAKEELKKFVEELQPALDEEQKQKIEAIVKLIDNTPALQVNPAPVPQDPRAE